MECSTSVTFRHWSTVLVPKALIRSPFSSCSAWWCLSKGLIFYGTWRVEITWRSHDTEQGHWEQTTIQSIKLPRYLTNPGWELVKIGLKICVRPTCRTISTPGILPWCGYCCLCLNHRRGERTNEVSYLGPSQKIRHVFSRTSGFHCKVDICTRLSSTIRSWLSHPVVWKKPWIPYGFTSVIFGSRLYLLQGLLLVTGFTIIKWPRVHTPGYTEEYIDS